VEGKRGFSSLIVDEKPRELNVGEGLDLVEEWMLMEQAWGSSG